MLFYFSLNSNPKPLKKTMKIWASNVNIVQGTFTKLNASLRPGSKASTSKTIVSASTIIDKNITISRKVDVEPRPIHSISPTSGGFQDEDEVFGPECDAAISSPIKGSGHLMSTINPQVLHYILHVKNLTNILGHCCS